MPKRERAVQGEPCRLSFHLTAAFLKPSLTQTHTNWYVQPQGVISPPPSFPTCCHHSLVLRLLVASLTSTFNPTELFHCTEAASGCVKDSWGAWHTRRWFSLPKLSRFGARWRILVVFPTDYLLSGPTTCPPIPHSEQPLSQLTLECRPEVGVQGKFGIRPSSSHPSLPRIH